eukprot:216536_1
MEQVWFDVIPWLYVSIQGMITLIVSILDVKYVRNAFLSQKNKLVQQTELQLTIQNKNTDEIKNNTDIEQEIEQKEAPQISSNEPLTEIEPKENVSQLIQEETEQFKSMGKIAFCKLWFKIVWKMRSVYCSLAVHVFDVLTDILVIVSWLHYPDQNDDDIDPQIMANCA